MEKLPKESVSNILSRLPLRSLARCKYVSKQWLAIIVDDPYFAKNLLEASLANVISPSLFFRNYDPGALFRNTVNADASFFLIDLCDEDRRVIPLDTPFRTYNDYQLHVVGFCNGILCFGNWIDSVEVVPQYLCNPVLGEYLKLPFLLCDQPGVHTVEAYGFGCDDRTGDYKVVSIFRKTRYEPRGGEKFGFKDIDGYPMVDDIPCPSECCVLTVGYGGCRVDSKWRLVGWVPCLNVSVENSGVLFNNRLHWLFHSEDDIPEEPSDSDSDLEDSNQVLFSLRKLCIFSLCLHDEVFRVIPLPPGREDRSSEIVLFPSLGVVMGCLALIENFDDEYIFVWVMKHYGREESWECVEDFTMMYNNIIKIRLQSGVSSPIFPHYAWNDGDMFVLNHGNLCLAYNPKNGKSEGIEIMYLHGVLYSYRNVWSIVSLKKAQRAIELHDDPPRLDENGGIIGRWDSGFHHLLLPRS